MSKMPIDLEGASKEDFKKFIDSFDHVFSDCDGVIWTVKPQPGSGEFFKLMEKLGKTVHFVSNNSIRTKENYEAAFSASKIDNGYERLTIPSIAIAEFLKSKNFTKQVYCITCTETLNALEARGIKCKAGPDIAADYYADFVNYLEDDPEIGAVVFDSDYKINMPKLYKALTYLKRPDVYFINGASDRYLLMKPGLLAIGVGVFSDIVRDETKREPIQMGKPGKIFGEFAMKKAKVTDPSRVLFIGDMIEQDVGLGKATGFLTLLVLTSNSKEDMLAHKTITPDYFARGLGQLVPQLEKLI